MQCTHTHTLAHSIHAQDTSIMWISQHMHMITQMHMHIHVHTHTLLLSHNTYLIHSQLKYMINRNEHYYNCLHDRQAQPVVLKTVHAICGLCGHQKQSGLGLGWGESGWHWQNPDAQHIQADTFHSQWRTSVQCDLPESSHLFSQPIIGWHPRHYHYIKMLMKLLK